MPWKTALQPQVCVCVLSGIKLVLSLPLEDCSATKGLFCRSEINSQSPRVPWKIVLQLKSCFAWVKLVLSLPGCLGRLFCAGWEPSSNEDMGVCWMDAEQEWRQRRVLGGYWVVMGSGGCHCVIVMVDRLNVSLPFVLIPSSLRTKKTRKKTSCDRVVGKAVFEFCIGQLSACYWDFNYHTSIFTP